MGGHYGSVQVRSEDRERVQAVAEQVAREKGIHILIAPPVNGWIALFPENHGQDDAVGGAVAEQLDADVLHLLVHDDDIFAYWALPRPAADRFVLVGPGIFRGREPRKLWGASQISRQLSLPYSGRGCGTLS
jgi:hypothetical protein